MQAQQRALAAYRHVLRAASLAFKGDAYVLNGARLQARQAFENGRSLQPDTKEHNESILHAEDVALILRQNVVQAQNKGEDSSADTWKLRIHEETERGDNDTVKQTGQRLKEKPAKSS